VFACLEKETNIIKVNHGGFNMSIHEIRYLEIFDAKSESGPIFTMIKAREYFKSGRTEIPG